MDSLTQIVLGAGVGELVLGKKIGNRALLWGGIAGTLPDLDVFFAMGDPIRELTIHRGFSHSITFAVLVAPVLAYLTQWIYRNKALDVSWRQWTWFFFLAVFTHPLLDCLTTYGTQLFYPFTDYRVSVSSIFILDPLYTLPFLTCLIVAAFYAAGSTRRTKWAAAGMIIGSSYQLLALANKQVAEYRIGTELEAQGIEYSNHMVGVTPLNILLWYGVYDVGDAYLVGYYSLMDPWDRPLQFTRFEKRHDLVVHLLHERGVDRIIWFGQGFWMAREAENGDINMYTLKFGTNAGPGIEDPAKATPFYFKVSRGANGQLVYTSVQDTENLDLGDALKRLFGRVMGGETF